MRIVPNSLACLLVALAAIAPANAQTPQKPAGIQPSAPLVLPPYAPVARHILAAPIVLQATIRSVSRIKDKEAVGVLPGDARFYVEADVNALIRGESALPPHIGYLVDVPLDAAGHAPKLNKRVVMLFARPVPGHDDQLQLIGPNGQQDWSAGLDARVRGIVQELVAAGAPPAITGLGNAFHVPGTLPGEGETQIFLTTDSGVPVSLQVLRRPGEMPRWAVSLGEIVDPDATAPPADTLLWFRLACSLPRELPASSLASETPDNAAAARADYAFVLQSLGPCATD